MRILVICRHDPFKARGGTEVFTNNLAVELVRVGHRVTVAYGSSKTFWGPMKVPYEVSRINRHEMKLLNVPYLMGLELLLKSIRLRRIPFDVAIGLGAMGIGPLFLSLRSSTPRPILAYYAIDCRFLEYREQIFALRQRGLSPRLIDFVLRFVPFVLMDKVSCDSSDLVFASSRDTAEALRAYYGTSQSKIRVLYLGVPDDFADGFDSVETSVPTFLHIMTDPIRRGTVYLLRALQIMCTEYHAKARAIIVGRDSFCENVARKLDVDAMFVDRRIPRDELKRLYASCTCQISPSVADGFNMPVLEAAMFGKPSIVSNASCLPELVKDGFDGYVVPLADVNSLAERMSRIATDEKLRRRMSRNAREKAKDFHISAVARNLIQILKEGG